MAKPGEQTAEHKLTKAEPTVALDPAAPSPVFVSYAREDRKRAEMIVALLKGAGFEVWWDGLMEAGTQFQRELSEAIDRSRAVVVLWSRHAAESVWVQDEAGCGRDRHCMVPISLDGTPAPLGFRQYQAIDFSHWKGRATAPEAESLIRAVAKAMQMAVPVACHPPRRAETLPRRTLLLAGGAAAAAVATYGVWRSGITGFGDPKTESIAVLPFANLSGDPAQTYFSDGLAAEIRSELARNPMLQVAAQASSESFRERREDAKTIAERLGVGYLLDGNVRRSGSTVRVAAELIDGRTGFSQWSRSFERPLADVFKVQSEIAAAVAGALGEKIGGTAAAPTERTLGGTTNIAAYDAYLRGRGLFQLAADEASDRAALAAFDAAIAADPGYAAAHAARSRSLGAIANQYATQGADRRRIYAESVSAAERAVALAPDLADAQSALGYALFYGTLNARAARAPFDRSYALGGGNADVLGRYALFCARTGRFDEAFAAVLKAEKLDPLNPRTWRTAGAISFAARRYAEAIAHNRRALSLNPRMGVANGAIGDAELVLGRLDAAEAAYRAEPNSLFGLTGLAIVANKRGDPAKAQALIAQLTREHGDNSLYQQAQIFAQAGERAKAVAALRRAREVNDSGVAIMRDDALLDPVRNDPGFTQLLRDVGLA